MSPSAITLILLAAVAHASWNLFSKQAGAAGAACFVWLYVTVSAIIYAPVTAVVIGVSHPRLSGLPAVFLAGTAAWHIAYTLLLQNGYRLGDLSVVYPIGRGTGALLAAVAGVVLLGERPGLVAAAGIALIVTGVLAIGLPGRRDRRSQPAAAAQPASAGPAAPAARPGSAAQPGSAAEQVRAAPAVQGTVFALLTGVCIAGYTVWDKYAVATLHTPPVVQDWATVAGVAVALAPVALRDRARLAGVWRSYRPQVLGAAVLVPLAYILVLTALRFTAVSVAAPSREVSVLFGVLLGRRLLGEHGLARRLGAAAAIVVGVVVIAVG